jgi:ribosomal protein S18 acetylase RimI-like enzyme
MGNQSLEFRDAGAADVDMVVALVESAYRGDASRAGWTTEADILSGQRTDAEAVEAIVDDPESRVLLGIHDGDVIACCHIERHDDYAYFGMFAVAPAGQGRGTGGAVMTEAERIVRQEWGRTEMRMTVISVRDDLIAWYERRGYRRTGKMSPFPYGDERFGIPRRDDLEFELLIKQL